MISIYSILTILLLWGLFRNLNTHQQYDFSLSNTYSARGFLILLVVLHHLFREYPIEIISHETEYYGKFAVACFFFLSGYGLMYSLQKKGKSYLNGFLAKKFHNLLPLVLSLTLFMFLLRYCFGGICEIDSIIHSSLTILPNSWFVWMLLFEYFAFYIIFCICGTKHLVIGGGIMLLTNVLACIILSNIGILTFWYARLFAINSGLFVAIYEGKLRRLLSHNAVFIFVACLLSIWIWYIHPTSRLLIIVDNLIPLVLYVICYFNNLSGYKILHWLGKYSLEIYLVHGVILYLMKQIL